MQVSDLIELLQQHDESSEVVIGYDYGDRSHTNAISRIRTVQLEVIVESAYSASGKRVADEEDTDPDNLDAITMVVINAVHR